MNCIRFDDIANAENNERSSKKNILKLYII